MNNHASFAHPDASASAPSAPAPANEEPEFANEEDIPSDDRPEVEPTELPDGASNRPT